MEWVYKIITRVEFYVLLVLIAAVAIFLSIFKDVPNQGNGYSPNVRESMLLPLFLLGVAILLTGIVAFFVRGQAKGAAVSEKVIKGREAAEELTPGTEALSASAGREQKRVPTASDYPEPDEDEHTTPVSASMTKEQEDELERVFSALSDTQQKILTHICQMPVMQMPIDDFFESFGRTFNPQWVGNESEMYYRLEVLHLKGFCKLTKIGPGASVVIRNAEISRCLRKRDLLKS
jgi:hypothetical protein